VPVDALVLDVESSEADLQQVKHQRLKVSDPSMLKPDYMQIPIVPDVRQVA
jgi:hypothetical protein